MNTPDDVIDLAATYLRIYFMGMPFVMLYNFGSAIFEKCRRHKPSALLSCNFRYCKCSFEPLLCNRLRYERCRSRHCNSNCRRHKRRTCYDVPHQKRRRVNQSQSKKLSLKKEHLIMILKIGAPAGIQGMVFSISNVFIQTAINGSVHRQLQAHRLNSTLSTLHTI